MIEKRKAVLTAGDTAEAERLSEEIEEVQNAISRIALEGLGNLSKILDDLRGKLESMRQAVLAWPFGQGEAPVDHERAFREEDLPDNDFEDAGPDQHAPAPAVIASGVVPTVPPGWASNYQALWDTMEVSATWEKTSRKIAEKIIAKQSRYAKAVSGTNVPWWFVAVVHCMECSLRFDQHLHNGDPLSERTRQKPSGRPAAGAPPFSWEQSARDALEYDRLLGVSDWSLKSVLYHWHRYNGINNAYKRNNIPTPYLWSGSQHYRKGKYVADGKFDPNAVSHQVGAAVLLRALVDIGAVKLSKNGATKTEPEAAAGTISALNLPLPGASFSHVKKELTYLGNLGIGKGGSGASKAERNKVRALQEWLNLNGCNTSIDEDFGPSTATQLKRFQSALGREPTGTLDPETWVLLTKKMRDALAPIEHGPDSTLEAAVIRVAKQHIAQKPEEVGGQNMGPWVRLYMEGQHGSAQKWCAGFVCFVVTQAARDMGVALPFRRQVGVDQLVADAKKAKRFIAGASLDTPLKRRSTLSPGTLFVVRRTSTDWTHVGLVLNVNGDDFDTLEGNTDPVGGVDGANAKRSNRAFASKDFLTLL
ncbi:peptidoglycan-binding protein [uncultured Cohaesibacter sp.]|uniref:peptidoglycan-binding protein n=1 Tax=uncultured Cohaesibacter sp. TaxID=1002546 RepID=UPI002AA8F984|nr:peptidoglycan-binding protein [uncultured Cohaesibacter sp.]